MAKPANSKGKNTTSKPKKQNNQENQEFNLDPGQERSVIVIDEPIEIQYEKNGIKIFKIGGKFRNKEAKAAKVQKKAAKKKVKVEKKATKKKAKADNKAAKKKTKVAKKTTAVPKKTKVKKVKVKKVKTAKPKTQKVKAAKTHATKKRTKPTANKVVAERPPKVRKPPKNKAIDEKVETISFGSNANRMRNYIVVDPLKIDEKGIKAVKAKRKFQKQLTSRYSKGILEKDIVTTTNYKPDISKHIIELHHVRKSYVTGDLETPVLKGMNIVLDKGDFIVILGPSGSGKTTFLNIISGLDKATEGDVFVLGANLTLLKDSHLTKFRRRNVGFIFQQYNLLTNLTAKENAEVGENLSNNRNSNMTIEDIFVTIGMAEQMNKYPHQMSGGQQQRVSIARALAKNPEILFADEPTGALDEEMGRKVLEILIQVNKQYKTTVIVVTHNPNIAKIGNTVIHIKNGLIDQVIKNPTPLDPSQIDWS